MTSTRLPGKVLKEVAGRPLLDYQIERLRRVHLADDVAIATTENDTDEPLVDFCRRRDVPFVRGSEADVLDRYYQAALACAASIIVRVTSDCPLIDPAVVDRVIAAFCKADGSADYASNTLHRTYPRGLDCEVFPFSVLEQAHDAATEKAEREHVTPYVYHHPELFRLLNVAGKDDFSRFRWTVDTPEDFELIRRMLEELYPANPTFAMEDCLRLLQANPEWLAINADIQQKALNA